MKRKLDSNYTFPVKVSELSYDSKPTDNEKSKMRFHPNYLSCTRFANLIQEGYAFCPTERKLADVKDCYVICIDVDDSTVPMETYVSDLIDIPSLYYTTPSNGNVQKSLDKYGDDLHRVY